MAADASPVELANGLDLINSISVVEQKANSTSFCSGTIPPYRPVQRDTYESAAIHLDRGKDWQVSIRREAWTVTSIAGYVARRRIIPAPEVNQMRVATRMHMEQAKKRRFSRERISVLPFAGSRGPYLLAASAISKVN